MLVVLRASGELVIAFRGTEKTFSSGLLQDAVVNLTLDQEPLALATGLEDYSELSEAMVRDHG